jgi:hypothetical protein
MDPAADTAQDIRWRGGGRLAAFMGGLAHGSWIAGRVEKASGNGAPHAQSFGFAHAALEVIVALVASRCRRCSRHAYAVTWAYHALRRRYVSPSSDRALFRAHRRPATAMGATFRRHRLV